MDLNGDLKDLRNSLVQVSARYQIYKLGADCTRACLTPAIDLSKGLYKKCV